MTNAHFTQNAPILVTIDIAKNWHEVLIDIPDRKRRRLSVLNTREEFDRCYDVIHVLAPGDHSRSSVDHRIPDRARFIKTCVSRHENLSTKSSVRGIQV